MASLFLFGHIPEIPIRTENKFGQANNYEIRSHVKTGSHSPLTHVMARVLCRDNNQIRTYYLPRSGRSLTFGDVSWSSSFCIHKKKADGIPHDCYAT